MSTDIPVTDSSLPFYSAPVNKKERILFLDSVRGIALLGILLMNSMAQSQSYVYTLFYFFTTGVPVNHKYLIRKSQSMPADSWLTHNHAFYERQNILQLIL